MTSEADFLEAAMTYSSSPQWPSGAEWVNLLPDFESNLIRTLHLTVVGAPMFGWASKVLPVRTEDGTKAVLKMGYPCDEAKEEPWALQEWADALPDLFPSVLGHGYGWMLLSFIEGDTLISRKGEDDVFCFLLTLAQLIAIEVSDDSEYRTLSSILVECCTYMQDKEWFAWRENMATLVDWCVRQPVCDSTLCHSDLHYGNVIMEESTGCPIVIDPKPILGNVYFDAARSIGINNDMADQLGLDLAGAEELFCRRLAIAEGRFGEQMYPWIVMHLVAWFFWGANEAPPPLIEMQLRITFDRAMAYLKQG